MKEIARHAAYRLQVSMDNDRSEGVEVVDTFGDITKLVRNE
jgi:hypothetical protein